jgi:hypothetical protein
MAIACSAALNSAASGQSSGGPVIRDSSVGYIDPAIPADMVRLRFDATYNNRQPARAELFYPQAAPNGPGPPRPDTSVDYQEFALYAEALLGECWSGFINAPVRLINPELNENAEGFGDLDLGIKYGLLWSDTCVLTPQLRVYVPTGDSDRGLGTHHVTLEPAILLYQPLSEQLRFEGELRYWAPIGGTDFAGDILRYGAGFSWVSAELCHPVPVLEFVGWSILNGQTSVSDGAGQFTVRDAGGTTIVHVKAGVRNRLGECTELFVGYGHPLTGEDWYEDTLRLELRIQY